MNEGMTSSRLQERAFRSLGRLKAKWAMNELKYSFALLLAGACNKISHTHTNILYPHWT